MVHRSSGPVRGIPREAHCGLHLSSAVDVPLMPLGHPGREGSAVIGCEPACTGAVSSEVIFSCCFWVLLRQNIHCPTNKFMARQEIVGDHDSPQLCPSQHRPC